VETSPKAGLPVVTAFAAERSHAGWVTLRVNAPLAQLVEVTGDFTNWTPVRLERASNGWWSATVPIDRGKYQMNVRLNGGKWLVPPGLLSMLDEFGGSVGLLVIE
jgi:1,4-alpha-glucan branching enzyme